QGGSIPTFQRHAQHPLRVAPHNISSKTPTNKGRHGATRAVHLLCLESIPGQWTISALGIFSYRSGFLLQVWILIDGQDHVMYLNCVM
ncbi:unnamed protein product, partial [Allacma fusca]